MNSKITSIFLNAIPVIFMVALIPIIKNDYLLTIVYVGIVILSLWFKYEIKDATIFVFGFLIMMTSEYLFLKTGVEKFNRNTLFGIMPLWLPFLWAYGFIAIKRSVNVLSI